jgi:predicted NUDIX family phosphoesterase
VSEKVLVFPEWVLEGFPGFGPSGGIVAGDVAVSRLMGEVFNRGRLPHHNRGRTLYSYADRDEAEADPSVKQVIPYVVIWRGREVFVYRRTKKGGEGRLHGKWSLGVGGHINPEDAVGDDPYRAGFLRELSEEVLIEPRPEALELTDPVAMIYDQANEVGRVHFGLVHFLHVPATCEVRAADPALADGHFQHAMQIPQLGWEWENWSSLVIRSFM